MGDPLGRRSSLRIGNVREGLRRACAPARAVGKVPEACAPGLRAVAALLLLRCPCCWAASQLKWPRPSWWEEGWIRTMGGGCCVMTMEGEDAHAVV
jgi:hypothetical protein